MMDKKLVIVLAILVMVSVTGVVLAARPYKPYFGEWQQKSFDSSYIPSTDGFVSISCSCTGASTSYVVCNGFNAQGNGAHIYAYGGQTQSAIMPVRAGDTWSTNFANNGCTVWSLDAKWLPLI